MRLLLAMLVLAIVLAMLVLAIVLVVGQALLSVQQPQNLLPANAATA